MISTGLQKLDDFLSGGIPDGIIVDIFGGNGTGKTQLLLQLSINSIKNGGRVLYLDTTGGFRPERILEIQKQSKKQINFLEQITVSRITNTSEQIKSIQPPHHLLGKYPRGDRHRSAQKKSCPTRRAPLPGARYAFPAAR